MNQSEMWTSSAIQSSEGAAGAAPSVTWSRPLYMVRRKVRILRHLERLAPTVVTVNWICSEMRISRMRRGEDAGARWREVAALGREGLMMPELGFGMMGRGAGA